MKKYELIPFYNETPSIYSPSSATRYMRVFVLESRNIKLKQIRALVDIPRHNVKVGDFGGFIEKESNLSHAGDCWVSNDAIVYGNAKVQDNALIADAAIIFMNAIVEGDALVTGTTMISNSAIVKGNSKIYGSSVIHGNAIVQGDVSLSTVHVNGDANLTGKLRLQEKVVDTATSVALFSSKNT